LEAARRLAGLSQDQLARQAHTSRTAVSAYENGRKKPTLDTAERLLGASGFDLDLRPRITFRSVAGAGGRAYEVPDHLPSLSPHLALATVELPLSLNWSQPGRLYRLRDRSERARVYEAVLREGSSQDVLTYIDGVLLVDLWDELVLPRDLHEAWDPLISKLWLRRRDDSAEDVPCRG
jgi:transcriptional regulator with XRE-family HTH domain